MLDCLASITLKGGTAYTPARNILGAFRNQLAAQRGKAVETACAAMLDINAAGLIKALGG